jgi:hypothetical protein
VPDQPSTSDYPPEPPRGRSIPDDFICDPETQAWYAPGEPSNWDQAAFSRRLQQTIREEREECIANGTWGNGTVIRLGPLRRPQNDAQVAAQNARETASLI